MYNLWLVRVFCFFCVFSLQAMMRPSSSRRLCWIIWKIVLIQMRHWWWVFLKVTSCCPIDLGLLIKVGFKATQATHSAFFVSKCKHYCLTHNFASLREIIPVNLTRRFYFSLPGSSTLLSGSATPPQRLKSPCVTRIRKMMTLQTDPNMRKRLRPPVKSCSVLKSARNSCAISSKPHQLILPHWSKSLN